MKNQNTFTLRSTNEARERAHLELALAVAKFELDNKVTVCRPQRKKASRAVTGTQKLAFGPTQPKNRPSNAWDLLLTN